MKDKTIDKPTYLQSPIFRFYQRILKIKNFPRNNKSLDLQRVDIISVSHTRREREPAKDKFEHWIERIKILHFTSLN